MRRRDPGALISGLLDGFGGGRVGDRPPLAVDGGTRVDSGGPSAAVRDRYDPDLDALEAIYRDADRAAVGDRHVAALFDLDPTDAESFVGTYREAGIDAASFADSQRVVSAALVEATFVRLRADLDSSAQVTLEAAEADLRRGLDTAADLFAAGVDAYDEAARTGSDDEAARTGSDDEAARIGSADRGAGLGEVDGPAGSTEGGRSDDALDYHKILHHVGTPLFVLDPAGNILTWNAQLAELTGVSEAEAMEMEMASMAFYPDGRRGKTLADKVLDAPERTHETYDVPRVDDASFTLYRDTSTMVDQHGEEVNISFSAAPIYDDDGGLAGVVEMVQDRTADVLRHEHTAALVTELEETMGAIRAGDLEARASFSNEEGHVDGSLLAVIDELNEMAETLARLIDRVDENATELATSTDRTASVARDIESSIVDQNEILTAAAEDVHDVSATMEEIAATSSQVASAASNAIEAVEGGVAASEGAQAVTDELTATSDELVDSVTGLEDRMDEVHEIIGIIADVAEQTNVLALNANIEAARAGESGAGFAVVADEVKTLATETGEYAERIAENVDEIQVQATETVGTVQESHSEIQRAAAKITEALDALDDIAEAVDEAAGGIEEVASANDDQADAIEGVSATIERARTHAEDAEAAAQRVVENTESQSASVAELVESVADLHNEASAE